MKRPNEVPTTVKSPANLLSIIVVVKFRSWMTVPENCHIKSGWILNLFWLMCYNQHWEIYSTGPNWQAVLKDAVSLNFYKSFIQIRLYLHGVLGSRWILFPSGSFVFSMVLFCRKLQTYRFFSKVSFHSDHFSPDVHFFYTDVTSELRKKKVWLLLLLLSYSVS